MESDGQKTQGAKETSSRKTASAATRRPMARKKVEGQGDTKAAPPKKGIRKKAKVQVEESKAAAPKALVKKASGGVRGIKRHKENPFLDTFVIETKGKLIQLRSSGDYIDGETGEITHHAAVYTRHFVDKEQHIKVYTKGIASAMDLSRNATKTFALVLKATQQQAIGRDMIFLHFMDAIEDPDQPMSKASFYKGLAELIENKFLAPATASNAYFINPAFFFNGDRFRFVSEYIKIKPSEEKSNPEDEQPKKDAKSLTKDMFEEFK